MKRLGTTLIEVLMAIFIMALGLVALLTLFPLGAIQMSRAVQDDRAAQLAGNAAAYCRMYWKTMCEQSNAGAGGGQGMYANMQGPADPRLQWFTAAMDDPNAGLPSNINVRKPDPVYPPINLGPAQNVNNAARKPGVSYPVFVDPVGWESCSPLTQERYWMGANFANGLLHQTPLPRRSLPGMSGRTAEVLRTFFLLDDMNFDKEGISIPSERQAQYSCAWMLRRDQNMERGDINLTVVVYFRRPFASVPNEPVYVGEPSFSAVNGVTTPGNTITINYAQGGKPPVRKGGWILDATMDAVDPQGIFYRVAEIGNEYPGSGSGNVRLDLTLESNLRPIAGSPPGRQRTIVVPEGILEVFDKGPLGMNSPSRIN